MALQYNLFSVRLFAQCYIIESLYGCLPYDISELVYQIITIVI